MVTSVAGKSRPLCEQLSRTVCGLLSEEGSFGGLSTGTAAGRFLVPRLFPMILM